ncbi:MAG TPA: hypothetical protein VHW00_17575 [Thermoanaerobaculia bacterium]|nr:hypothetical protein [Thermoanaerobaculia bacterium]
MGLLSFAFETLPRVDVAVLLTIASDDGETPTMRIIHRNHLRVLVATNADGLLDRIMREARPRQIRRVPEDEASQWME